jgi:hypothetical protein
MMCHLEDIEESHTKAKFTMPRQKTLAVTIPWRRLSLSMRLCGERFASNQRMKVLMIKHNSGIRSYHRLVIKGACKGSVFNNSPLLSYNTSQAAR